MIIKPRWSVIVFMSVLVGLATALVQSRAMLNGDRDIAPLPAAESDGVIGTFTSGDVTISLEQKGRGYNGIVRRGSAVFPCAAWRAIDSSAEPHIEGHFQANGVAYNFVAVQKHDLMILTTGDTQYQLRRTGNPLTESTIQITEARP